MAVAAVARELGNTPAVCRNSYIHPAVIESYLDGTLAEALKQRTEQKLTQRFSRLRGDEAAVLALLQERLKREANTRRNGG